MIIHTLQDISCAYQVRLIPQIFKLSLDQVRCVSFNLCIEHVHFPCLLIEITINGL